MKNRRSTWISQNPRSNSLRLISRLKNKIDGYQLQTVSYKEKGGREEEKNEEKKKKVSSFLPHLPLPPSVQFTSIPNSDSSTTPSFRFYICACVGKYSRHTPTQHLHTDAHLPHPRNPRSPTPSPPLAFLPLFAHPPPLPSITHCSETLPATQLGQCWDTGMEEQQLPSCLQDPIQISTASTLPSRCASPASPSVHADADIRNFAPVARIMKTALPENAKIAKEAKECMQECVSEFISFITSEGETCCLCPFPSRQLFYICRVGFILYQPLLLGRFREIAFPAPTCQDGNGGFF